MAFGLKWEKKSGFKLAAGLASLTIFAVSAVWIPVASAEQKDTKTQEPKVETTPPQIKAGPLLPKIVLPADPVIKEPIKPTEKTPTTLPGVKLDPKVLERPILGGYGLKIDPDLLGMKKDLAERLDRVHMKKSAFGFCDPRGFLDRLDRPDLIVNVHQAHERSIFSDRFF